MKLGPGRTVFVILSFVVAITSVQAGAAEEECLGARPTISWDDPGVGRTIVGTDGDDVIQGGGAEEFIRGAGGEDVICGGNGGDLIEGGPGADTLLGETGGDTFISGKPGSDLTEDAIFGGEGEGDTADFRRSPVGVRVNLATRSVLGDDAEEPVGIQGVEDVKGSPQSDELIGDKHENRIEGLGGDDFVDGQGKGDRLSGGEGIDQVSYESARAAIKLTLFPGTVQVGPAVSGDLDFINTFERAIGSKFDDRLEGSDKDDQLTGGPGDDVIKGLEGHDNLEGGEGDDTIHPGLGDDYVDGGPSDPVTSAGEHGDLATYANDEIDPNNDEAHQQFEAYLTPDRFGNPPGSSGVGDDVFESIESVRGVPGKTNIIIGDDGPNVLISGGRTDVIEGRGGNDLLFGLNFGDNLYGEAGDDFLDGGGPEGENDTDRTVGGEGTDTCIGAEPSWIYECENSAQRV